ncbi:MAG TPA: DegQ family serine endoprotease [Nitrospirae bacterium]|nr:putative periplasmic serine endoprotease DegP-like precursor [bacterium BMS3Abin06]HDH11526.1 DegQ family serine endoprotease [Nitrospirota bacterium]HDZ03403.1 DegQ family serine endoprotease [Nitrospirota bacterium]
MLFKKVKYCCAVFVLSVVLLSSTAALALASYQSGMDIYKEKPKISGEAVDFLTKTGQALAEVAEAVKPAIVNISTVRTEKIMGSPFSPFYNDPFFRKFFGNQFRHPQKPRERKSASLGSGVIVSPDGYILTNNHVIKNADKIKVLLPDKREFTGRIIGSDPKTDLSVIKIDAGNLSTLSFGNSDALRVGELVLTIGSPYGLNQTVTMGIVSAVGRANVGIAEYEDFIQTDAAINPGNSGGALVNVKGELVGINTAIFSTTGGYQGIGFAIPSNMAKIVMDSLIEKGKVIRGWLGVSIQAITPELAQQFRLEKDYGTLVADVVEGSPAEKAGLMRGDVIIEFNGKKIDEPYILRNIVADTPPGTEAEMKVIRDGEIKSLTVTIVEIPAKAEKTPAVFQNALKGVSVQDLTPDIYRQLNLPEKIRGVVITDIESESPADTRLLPGDVILEINRKAISDIEDYEAIVSKIKPDMDVLLLVFRRGSTIFITISGEPEQ